MKTVFTNDKCTGCNKCVRTCPVLTANVATTAAVTEEISAQAECLQNMSDELKSIIEQI